MFVGHYAVSFAARRSTVDLPLWVWFLAVQWLDILFVVLILGGIEKVRITPGFTQSNDLDLYYYPYTHSLIGALILSMAFAVLVALVFPAARSAAGLLLLAGASLSHWVLDFVVHTPDLPLFDTSTKVGLGLWNHVAISLPLELAFLAACAWIYTKSRAGAARKRQVWTFVMVMALAQAYFTFAPPPESPTLFALVGLGGYLAFAGAARMVEGKPMAAG